MALETGTYISDLVSTNPVGTDTLDKADDHLRLLKATVKATFPNISGVVNATHTELNLLESLIESTNGRGFLRNRIINGDMRIDQRNAGASVTPTVTSQYVLDRWNHNLTVASKYSVQRNAGSVTPPAGFVNYMGVTSLSAYSALTSDLFGIVHPIEGYNIADLDFGKATAKTITLSFWVRSSLTGTHAAAVLNGTSARSYTFTYTISAANTWEYKTATIPGDTAGTWATDQTLGMSISFNLGAGSTYATAAGAWTAGAFTTVTGAVSVVGTNAATFYITGAQLEAGSVATPFERRQYGTELALCQRYYEKSFSPGTAPVNGGSATTYGDANAVVAGVCMNSTYGGAYFPFKVVKRGVPTVALYGNNAGFWSYGATNAVGTFAATACSPTITENGFSAAETAVNSVFQWIAGHYTASAEL